MIVGCFVRVLYGEEEKKCINCIRSVTVFVGGRYYRSEGNRVASIKHKISARSRITVSLGLLFKFSIVRKLCHDYEGAVVRLFKLGRIISPARSTCRAQLGDDRMVAQVDTTEPQ